ncbi:MAG TPA: hypothetical protein VNI84_19405 [Pyrinomonadaceae bacterium]|nr:hypothetical protein [Pyrinomonadaceae bacterium]
MENMTGNSGVDEKTAKTARTMRVFWMVLIGIFFAVIVLRVLNWIRDGGDLYGILSPLGMIFVGLVQMRVTSNKAMQTTLLVAGMVFVLAGLVMAIIG